MTETLLIILLVLSTISILVSLFKKTKADDGKIVDSVKLMGDMIAKNQKLLTQNFNLIQIPIYLIMFLPLHH